MYSQHENIDNMRFGSNSGIEDQTPQAVNYEKSSGDPGVDTTHLPPNLLAITETLQQQLKAPLPTVFGAVMATIGSLFSQRYVVEGLRCGSIPLNTYVLIASDTGEGKSSVLARVLAPLREFEEAFVVRNKEQDTAAQADVILKRAKLTSLNKKLRDAVNEDDDKKAEQLAAQIALLSHGSDDKNVAVRMLLSDCTLPGLKRVLSNNPFSVLIANAEASKFLNEHLISHADTYCAAWSGEPFKIYQGKVTIEETNPKLSMLLMTQTAFIEGLLEEDNKFRVSGLAARFLLFQPLSMRGRKHLLQQELPDTQEILARWRNFLLEQCERNRLAMIADVPRTTIQLSADAQKFILNVEKEIEHLTSPGQKYHKINDIAFRMVEHICRFAAIFQLHEYPDTDVLSIDFVQKAYRFLSSYLNYCVCMVAGNTPGSTVYSNANKILQFFMRSAKVMTTPLQSYTYSVKVIKVSDFQRNAPVRHKRNTDSLLELLAREGRIEFIKDNYWDGYRWQRANFILIKSLMLLEKPSWQKQVR